MSFDVVTMAPRIVLSNAGAPERPRPRDKLQLLSIEARATASRTNEGFRFGDFEQVS